MHCFVEGSQAGLGLASQSQSKETCPCVIKREGKQQGVLFRRCPPKWGSRGGMVWPRKLAKLMVIGGFAECMGPGGRGREGRAPSLIRADKIGKRNTLREQRCLSSLPPEWTARLPWGQGTCREGSAPHGEQSPRPSFVQLTQTGPSLSPADSKAGS